MIHGVLFQIVQATQTVTEAFRAGPASGLPAIKFLQVPLLAWDLIVKGGLVIIPIAVLLLAGIYIFVERYIVIGRASKEDARLMDNIRDFMYEGRQDAALSLCQDTNTPLSRMIEKGLHRIGLPLNEINAAIETVGSLEVAKLEKNISLLATIAGASPLLGFLGTIVGFVRTFYAMSVAGNNLDIRLLSGGIYQAMVTTIAGLIAGIITYFCYNILVARVQKTVFNLQYRASEFMDLLHNPKK